ncbi:MAG: hypothetical protein IJW48_04215 [Clostridia bacterium]|nr:hypothetical protein [Clostridia bacterium]
MQNKNENRENNSFNYTYSASEQAELKRIRAKYERKGSEEVNKMERLRHLDRSVTEKAEIVSLVFGIVGALILGFGMSLIMTELHAYLGLGAIAAMVLGIIMGVLGGVVAALAYPTYAFVIKRERARVAPEILKLTEELLK